VSEVAVGSAVVTAVFLVAVRGFIVAVGTGLALAGSIDADDALLVLAVVVFAVVVVAVLLEVAGVVV
jgi:hypothetical protein